MSDKAVLGFFGNVWMRQHGPMRKGDGVAGHAHYFDHITTVDAGAVLVRVKRQDGTTVIREFRAPTFFVVRAECEHSLTALEDGTTWRCVYGVPDEIVRSTVPWQEEVQAGVGADHARVIAARNQYSFWDADNDPLGEHGG